MLRAQGWKAIQHMEREPRPSAKVEEAVGSALQPLGMHRDGLPALAASDIEAALCWITRLLALKFYNIVLSVVEIVISSNKTNRKKCIFFSKITPGVGRKSITLQMGLSMAASM